MSTPKTATSIRLSTAHGLQPLSKWRAGAVSSKWFVLPARIRRRNIWSQGAQQLRPQCKVAHTKQTLRSALTGTSLTHPLRLYSCSAGTNATSQGTRKAVIAAENVATAFHFR